MRRLEPGADPSLYDADTYVSCDNDPRPACTNHNGACQNVSPALNGRLGFEARNGTNDSVSWQFVDDEDVPDGLAGHRYHPAGPTWGRLELY